MELGSQPSTTPASTTQPFIIPATMSTNSGKRTHEMINFTEEAASLPFLDYDYSCPICKEIMYKPLQSTKCPHSICSECSIKIRERNEHPCPICKAPRIGFVRNLTAENFIRIKYPEMYRQREHYEYLKSPMGRIKAISEKYREFRYISNQYCVEEHVASIIEFIDFITSSGIIDMENADNEITKIAKDKKTDIGRYIVIKNCEKNMRILGFKPCLSVFIDNVMWVFI